MRLIAGGKSNLTYLVTSAAGEVVLRRPPLGHLLPTAHDMGREARVMAALAGTPVPVPVILHVCTDPQVLGQPFYVMSRVAGLICRDSLPAGYADRPQDRQAIAQGLIDVLADLHAVDPARVGLDGFGRPEGYLERQLRRWSRQWEASRTEPLPELDALVVELTADLPASGPAALVHGDYRLDNTMLDPHRPGRILAVLDWEMSTLGDPLADLGLLLVYWAQADDADQPTVVASVTGLPGFPRRAEVAQLYAQRTGRDLAALPWYVAFGYFKLAVVVQGIWARAQADVMGGQPFAGYTDLVASLVRRGRRALSEGQIR